MGDSEQYLANKRKFSNMLTIYGRKPVLEALEDSSIPCYRLHLANSNKPSGIIDTIIKTAEQRGIEINTIDKKALSRISRNGKQDQGVAADLLPLHYSQLTDFISHYTAKPGDRFIALDNVSNPVNVGMIIRSAAAAGVTAVVVPEKGCAELGPLVIKASVGTLFKCPIIRCGKITDAITALQQKGVRCYALAADAKQSLFDIGDDNPALFLLGNETEGIGSNTAAMVDQQLRIPMQNNVESLNVAVTASLVAFLNR